MSWLELLALVFGFAGSGAGVYGIVTLKSQAKKAKAEADSVEIDNSQKIVNMWKQLNDELSKELNSLKRSVDKLTRAIAKANECPGADNCIALKELNKQNQHEN